MDQTGIEQDKAFAQALPPEYAEQLKQWQRKLAMAQALQQAGMGGGNEPTQVVSGYAVKQSPFAGLAKVAQALAGTYMANKAQTGISDTQKKYQTDLSAAMQGLTALKSPEEQANYAQVSQFPALQALAKQFRDRQYKVADTTAQQKFEQEQQDRRLANERLGKGADLLGNTFGGTANALQMLASGAYPATLPQVQAPPTPTFGTDPQGNTYAQTTDVKGQTKVDYAPKPGASVNIKLPGMEANTALDILKTDLKTRQERAQTAKEGLVGTTGAIQALNSGAQAGGLEGTKQAIRKVAQGFGIANAATAPTEQLIMNLADAVLADAKRLRPASDTDIKFLQQTRGSIGNDPTALRKMLEVSQRLHRQELENYNKWVDTQGSNLQTPYAADMFRGAKIGYETPEAVPIQPAPPSPGSPIPLDQYLQQKLGGKR